MNKKGNMLVQGGVFLGLWLISSIVWSWWFDGANAAVAGCITALLAVGALNLTINWGG